MLRSFLLVVYPLYFKNTNSSYFLWIWLYFMALFFIPQLVVVTVSVTDFGGSCKEKSLTTTAKKLRLGVTLVVPLSNGRIR